MHDFCNRQLKRLDEVENNTSPEDNILVAKEPEAVDVETQPVTEENSADGSTPDTKGTVGSDAEE